MASMEISLDRRSGVGAAPVYRQIAAQIRAQIVEGQLDAGDRLPPIRQLARSLGVNRDTVALAYDELASEGSLESSVGRGTFVRSPRLTRTPLAAPGLVLSPHIEGLLEFERARPHYGAGAHAIPFHALVPDPSLYPVDAFRRSVNRVLSAAGAELLLYGDRQGDPQLRALLAARFAQHGIDAGAANVTICHGASQGIALALRLFTRPGDAVAVEEPTYTNVLSAIRSLGLVVVPVPMGEDGPDLGRLEQVLAQPEVKLLYTIPTFHNPLGTTSSSAHRHELLALAARTGKPVVEDAYEMDLRFEGREVPPLAALDPHGIVVHLYSLSKSLFPGARVGAITARGRVVEGLRALRHATDLGGSLVVQAAVADLLERGDYDRHLHRLRRILRSRMGVLLEALESEMPSGTRWTRPQGGYQAWVELPEPVDTRELLADAMRAGVLFAPGTVFQHDGRSSTGLRLTVAQVDEDRIRRGVGILAEVVHEHIRAGHPAAGASVQL
jgi:DNA-binding transcriptional MocR family regulator